MSGKVQVGVVDTERWALGARLVNPHAIENDILRPLFNGAMMEIASIVNVNFEPVMVERVWTLVSKEKITELNDIFLVEFFQKILGVFSPKNISDMLWDIITVGSIQDKVCRDLLDTAMHLEENLIEDVAQKNCLLFADWIPVIVQAVEKEGFSLLNPR